MAYALRGQDTVAVNTRNRAGVPWLRVVMFLLAGLAVVGAVFAGLRWWNERPAPPPATPTWTPPAAPTSSKSPEPDVATPPLDPSTGYSRSAPTPGVDEDPDRLLPAVTAATTGAWAAADVPGLDTPPRWSPCRPVRLVVNPAGGPDDAVAQVKAAAEDVQAATGLRLIVDGTTDEPVRANRRAYQPDRYGDRWAPVLVAWSNQKKVPQLAGLVVGVTFPTVATPTDGDGAWYVSGRVILDKTGSANLPATLRHEFGHLVGLGHVEDPRELMNPVLETSGFSGGDLEGLAYAGQGPCTTAL